MFQLKIDLSEVERAAVSVGGAIDQVPFVMASIMNTAAFATRKSLVQETWPQHVTQRRTNFPRVVMHVDTASKAKLSVTIRERDAKTPSLLRHAVGGSKKAAVARTLAIPDSKWVVRTPRGVQKSMTPSSLIAHTPKRALRVTDKGIFVGVGGRLVMRYVFKVSVTQPKDVPFYEDFASDMQYAMTTLFEPRMLAAMRTRRTRR